MLELGRAQKTIFLARYLRDRDLQREINEGLNLIEAWNRVNGVIFYGKSGEFATNRRGQQELGMLALHILQAALVYVNTLMIQDILAEPEWADVLTPEDLRGLTPLFWAHVLPYGEVKLNMTKRLALTAPRRRRDRLPSRAEQPARQQVAGGSRSTCHLVPRSLTAPLVARPTGRRCPDARLRPER
jgi:hypothetical protein